MVSSAGDHLQFKWERIAGRPRWAYGLGTPAPLAVAFLAAALQIAMGPEGSSCFWRPRPFAAVVVHKEGKFLLCKAAMLARRRFRRGSGSFCDDGAKPAKPQPPLPRCARVGVHGVGDLGAGPVHSRVRLRISAHGVPVYASPGQLPTRWRKTRSQRRGGSLRRRWDFPRIATDA